jgi:hypothetical protein
MRYVASGRPFHGGMTAHLRRTSIRDTYRLATPVLIESEQGFYQLSLWVASGILPFGSRLRGLPRAPNSWVYLRAFALRHFLSDHPSDGARFGRPRSVGTHMFLHLLLTPRESPREGAFSWGALADNRRIINLMVPANIYLSATTSISKSSMVSLSFLENAPSFAPKISIFLNPSVLRSHVISLGT